MGTLGITLGMIGIISGFILLFVAGLSSPGKTKTKLFLISIALIILGIIFGVTAEPSSKSKDGCRNCGRKTDLVAGFGFCYNCYESFVDWQED